MAEICSKYPTAAGAYYWCFRLASPRSRVLLSWINGWLNLVGVWTVCLSVTFGTTQLLIAELGMWHPEWVPETWHTCELSLDLRMIMVLLAAYDARVQI